MHDPVNAPNLKKTEALSSKQNKYITLMNYLEDV